MRCANWAQWGIKEKNRIHKVGRETRGCWRGMVKRKEGGVAMSQTHGIRV